MIIYLEDDVDVEYPLLENILIKKDIIDVCNEKII